MLSSRWEGGNWVLDFLSYWVLDFLSWKSSFCCQGEGNNTPKVLGDLACNVLKIYASLTIGNDDLDISNYSASIVVEINIVGCHFSYPLGLKQKENANEGIGKTLKSAVALSGYKYWAGAPFGRLEQ